MSFWLLKVAANQNRWKEQNHWKERLITIINRGAAFNLELSANAQLNAGRSGLKPTDYIIYKLIQKLYTVVCSRSFSASIFYSRIHPHWRLFWSFLSSHRVSARGWPFRAGFWLIIKCHGNPTLKASISYRFHGREYFQLCYIERTVKTRDYGHLFEIRAALLLLLKPANIVQ